MYVVRRAFRDRLGVVTAGSIIEPADIVRFRYRMQEGHIIEVDEQNYNEYFDFFLRRYKITLPPLSKQNSAAKVGAYALGKGPIEVSAETIEKAAKPDSVVAKVKAKAT